MKYIETDKRFYKKLVKIALPIAMQSVITTGVNLVDTIMLGTLGETALSASSLATQFITLFTFLCMGISMGASVLTSRYWGAQNKDSLRETITVALRFTVVLALVFTAVNICVPRQIMELYTNESPVIEGGTVYLQWSTITYMYNSTGSSILGAIVRKKTGEGLQEYLSKRLFCKIGIDPDNIRWYCMPDGMEMGGGGMLATTEDNLRLMKLYADGGVWEGERILAEDYVRLATTNQNDSSTEALNNPEASDNFLGYGFQIWMCKPKGVYRADGAMGQFTIVSPEQDLLIAINETAVGAHWAQSTLNITWDFLEKVGGETLEEDPQSAGRLAQKMRCLNLPNPVFQPLSPIASKISGRTYTVQSGVLSTEIFNFMSGEPVSPITDFSFAFDSYGCIWNVNGPNGTQAVRIATNGCRFTNLVGKAEDQTQLLVCDGAWTEEDTFAVNLRWAETCLTKKLVFHFDCDGITVEDTNNSAFRRSEDGPDVIVAK